VDAVRTKSPLHETALTAALPIREMQDLLISVLGSAQRGATDAVDLVLAQGAYHGASDIHFEPWDDCLSIRFRIDGILHEIATIPKEYQGRYLARLKVLAQMVVYQKDVPQDGRIEGDQTPSGQAMRVSTFPTVNGEKVVIRILGSLYDVFDLDSLGFQPQVIAELRAILSSPQGSLLLTGPSSSGKTTSIYSMLQELRSMRESVTHIVTIEDPVECSLDRIAQTQVNPTMGFTFSIALRSILRQDPEVIMLGEIRDVETAQTAIQAGLTGHFVISTIHSGSAAGVFTRLLDMGIEPYLVASSITGVLAQRLVRVNCPECVAPYHPDSSLLAQFGLKGKRTKFHKGKGCDECDGIGYRGRIALGELLVTGKTIEELVMKRPRTLDLHEAALANKMQTLVMDGVAKVKEGITTLEELRRVLPRERDVQ
jgi:type IV pilus assembly protein PilB